MDFKEIKELIKVFDKSELNKLKVKNGDFEISMQTGFESGTVVSTTAAPVAAAPVAPAAVATPAAPAAILGDTIDSPMVGTYYSSPSPESTSCPKQSDTTKLSMTYSTWLQPRGVAIAQHTANNSSLFIARCLK